MIRLMKEYNFLINQTLNTKKKSKMSHAKSRNKKNQVITPPKVQQF